MFPISFAKYTSNPNAAASSGQQKWKSENLNISKYTKTKTVQIGSASLYARGKSPPKRLGTKSIKKQSSFSLNMPRKGEFLCSVPS